VRLTARPLARRVWGAAGLLGRGALAALLLIAASQPAGAGRRPGSRWLLEAVGLACVPARPERFRQGWGAGLGIGGSLRRELGPRFELGLDAEFVQFSYEGLPRQSGLGGERRFARFGAPLRLHLGERETPGRERLDLQFSAGWGYQSIAGIFGEGFGSEQTQEDGLAVTSELRFSRLLFGATRWSVALRYSWFDLETDAPAHLGLVLGAEMPLAGSRPR
jgi:hypothetical protein